MGSAGLRSWSGIWAKSQRDPVLSCVCGSGPEVFEKQFSRRTPSSARCTDGTGVSVVIRSPRHHVYWYSQGGPRRGRQRRSAPRTRPRPTRFRDPRAVLSSRPRCSPSSHSASRNRAAERDRTSSTTQVSNSSVEAGTERTPVPCGPRRVVAVQGCFSTLASAGKQREAVTWLRLREGRRRAALCRNGGHRVCRWQ